MNGCRGCNEEFTSLSAFDQHLPPIVDGPKQLPCPDPASQGLERKSDGRWGLPGSYDWRGNDSIIAAGVQSMAEHRPATERPAYVHAGPRPCATCGKQMVKSKAGRGRFPKNCQGCGGTGLLTG